MVISPDEMRRWNKELKAAEERDTYREIVNDIRALVKCCQDGEEVHTIKMLRERLNL